MKRLLYKFNTYRVRYSRCLYPLLLMCMIIITRAPGCMMEQLLCHSKKVLSLNLGLRFFFIEFYQVTLAFIAKTLGTINCTKVPYLLNVCGHGCVFHFSHVMDASHPLNAEHRQPLDIQYKELKNTTT